MQAFQNYVQGFEQTDLSSQNQATWLPDPSFLFWALPALVSAQLSLPPPHLLPPSHVH